MTAALEPHNDLWLGPRSEQERMCVCWCVYVCAGWVHWKKNKNVQLKSLRNTHLELQHVTAVVMNLNTECVNVQ